MAMSQSMGKARGIMTKVGLLCKLLINLSKIFPQVSAPICRQRSASSTRPLLKCQIITSWQHSSRDLCPPRPVRPTVAIIRHILISVVV